MNILHVCDMKFTSGQVANGIITVVEALSEAQRKCGNNVLVASITVNEAIKNLPFHVICDNKASFNDEIESFKPDIVIFHSLYQMKFLQFANLLNNKGIPYFIEFHGGASKDNAQKGKFKKWLANMLLFNRFIRNARRVIYLNQSEEDSSVFSSEARGSIIVPNGIVISGDHKTYVAKPRVEFIFLSRIAWVHKGLDFLLDALSILQESGWSDRIHFSFYGPLRLPEEFMTRIQTLSSIASYHGAVFGDKKDEVLRESDIYILTSRYEGMPMTILEALNQGCPCLLTQETNMCDIITDGNSGWTTELSAVRIADNIKTAVAMFKQNPQKWIDNAYASVEKYSWAEIALKSVEQYKEAIMK